MIRVLIAHATTLIRIGVREILSRWLLDSRAQFELAEASAGAEVLATLRGHRWDLCLMDIALPQRGGLEVLRHIRVSEWRPEVLFLSSYCDRAHAATALRLGARGLLCVDCTADELQFAFRTVLNGGCYASPSLSEQIVGATIASGPTHSKLSQREFQIFQKLARGTAITVISRELSISPKSVSTYRSRILEKMRCSNNAEITQYAVREGLI